MNSIGMQLKRARKNKKMTQKQLADILKVEQSTISNYEKGLRHPPSSTLIGIAKVLDVSVDYLLGTLNEFSNNIDLSSEANANASEDINLFEIKEKFFDLLINGYVSEAYRLILTSSLENIGLKSAYDVIFDPTLKRIGELWERGEISIAEEHVITNVIDQLVVELSNYHPLSTTVKPLKAAFILPSAEEHQIPLKVSAGVFKNAGWETNYIGKSIPFHSLEAYFLKNRVDVIVISVTLKEHLDACELLIRSIKNIALPYKLTVVIGGSAIDNERIAINQLGADLFVKSFDDLEKIIDQIEKNCLLL